MMVPTLGTLKVKLFTDGADKAQIVEMAKQAWIAGFTTNPSLLKKAGVSDYEAYARDLVAAVPDRHISFEVFSDDIPEMVAQARVITAWGDNVHVKLPVTTTRGEPLFEAVRALSRDGVKINMTAIFTDEQVAKAVSALDGGAPALCIGVRRPAGRFRHRLPADDAGRGRARAPDQQCRDHLGFDPRSVQRGGGRCHGLPHHHRARRRAEEAAGARQQDGGRALARARLRPSATTPSRRGCGSPLPPRAPPNVSRRGRAFRTACNSLNQNVFGLIPRNSRLPSCRMLRDGWDAVGG